MKQAIILFADNDAEFLETRAELIQRKTGFMIIFALDPIEAKNVLEQGSIDLAILDLHLFNDEDENDFSGLDLARQIAPSIPKIILTKFPSWESVREALGTRLDGLPPAVDFIAKQEGPQALLTALHKALSMRESRGPNDLAMLRRLLTRHFDLEELCTICFDLGVDFDSLRGDGKAAKARELVAALERQDKLADLVDAIRRERPGMI